VGRLTGKQANWQASRLTGSQEKKLDILVYPFLQMYIWQVGKQPGKHRNTIEGRFIGKIQMEE
jgi:hypothetical protein